jgi:preprotein translocase subunit SecE
LRVRVSPALPLERRGALIADIDMKIGKYLGEVRAELKKATWPWDPKEKGLKKYKQLIDSTIVVLIAVILLAGFVQFWDFIQILTVGFLTDIFR